MAESYISALSADFDPSEYSDHYREALESVIEAKAAGREMKAPVEQAPASGQVVDLMEALRRSVAEAKSRRGEAPAQDAPAEKTAAKARGQEGGREEGRKEDHEDRQEGDEDDQPKATEKKAAARRSA